MKKIYLLLLLSCMAYLGYAQCTPGYTYPSAACSTYMMDISLFRITGHSGSTLSDATACTGAGYLYRTSDTVRMQQAGTYSSTIACSGSSYTLNCQVWIDYNNNLTWESSESVGGLNNYGPTGTFNITIPIAAAVGPHRMRITELWTGDGITYPSLNPCAPGYSYGETRDYTAVIVALPGCSGTINAGNATSSVSSACSTSPITLNLSGSTVASGITYQWQTSTDTTTWTSISGATSLPYSFTGITTTRYYRCIATCTSSSSIDTSGWVRILNLPCYCTPYYSSAGYACTSYDMVIHDNTLNGYGGTRLADSAACTGSGYLNRTSLSVDMQQSITYALSTSTGSTYNMNAQVWIDFSNNGTFETSESVGGLNNYRNTTAFNLTIPLTAPVGTRVMRMVTSYASSGFSYPTMSPCPSYTYGEARDYVVNIIALPSCSGVPNAGIATASIRPACSTDVQILNLSGATAASSLTYQWQSSSDSVTWTNITGATTYPYSFSGMTSSTYYRCIVVCSVSSGRDTSAHVYVPSSPCYCAPYYSSASLACGTYNMTIKQYLANGYGGTSFVDTMNCDGSGYILRSALTVDFQQSIAYTMTIGTGTTYAINCQTWIDFNNNGTFETTESVGGLNNYRGLNNNFTLTIPLTAATGLKRMRLVTSYAPSGFTYPTMSPCPSYTYGETRDYFVNIVALPACSGTPSGGNATADLMVACNTETQTLRLSGSTSASSLTYQWQSSTDSSTWTNITGATTIPYSFTGMTVSTYYRCIVTCSIGGASATSVPVYVRTSPCYCRPTFTSATLSCTSYTMSIVGLRIAGYGGTRLGDSARCDGSGYLSRTALSVDLQQSIIYNTTITTGSTYRMNCQTWIDFNSNGTFESTESVGGMNSFLNTSNYNITIPLTAPTGLKRMRVLVNYTGTSYPSMAPCGTYTYGEARDYTVNIVALPPCSGTPNAGIAIADLNAACSTDVQILSLAGATIAGSMTYQWQSSSDSVSWTNISGATTTPYSFTGMTASTYYRCVVTCTISGSSSTSRIVFVRSSACYCRPSYTSGLLSCTSYGMSLDTFATTGFGSSRLFDNMSCDGSGYLRRTGLVVDMMQTFTYNVTISSVSSTYQMACQTWIDFNDNGTFETSESMGGLASYSGTGGTGSSGTFSITIPFTVPPGLHRMRVVNSYVPSGFIYPSMNPCTPGYTYGEGRDYTVNVLLLPPCSGTPTAGAARARMLAACPTDVQTLSLVGSSIATSLTYQWQESPNDTTWTNMSGATNFTHTFSGMTAPTYYRCIVTCSLSGLSANSSSVFVGTSPCYCVPRYTADSASCAGYRMSINAFMINGESGTMIDDHTPCDGTGYEILTYMSCDLQQGSTYATTISTPGTFNMNCQTWIDFNDNGTFETSESVGGANNYRPTSVFSLVVPTSARLGIHRMRVVTSYVASSFTYPTLDPCTRTYTFGDARDYSVRIMTNICSGTPSAGSISATTLSGCGSISSSTLRLTGASSGSTVLLQWQSSTDSTTWTNITGATTTSYTATSLSSSIYYRVIVTCTLSSLSSTTRPVRLVVNPVPSAISTSGTLCEGSFITLVATPAGGTWSSSATSIATVDATAGVLFGVAPGTTTVMYTLASGCSNSRSVVVNALPAVITGPSAVCQHSTITLSTTATGGSWSSSNPLIGTISTGGTVTGLGAGTITISYTNSTTGCARTTNITVNPLPAAITGSAALCTGSTTMMGNATSGGTWTSSAPSIATINSTTGAITALTIGSATITYTLSTGCYETLRVSVNPAVAAITGPTSVCEGASITLSNTSVGGTWTSSDSFIARIPTPTSGVVNGRAAGVAIITYTLSSGCSDTAVVTVNDAPSAFTGTNAVCIGEHVLWTTMPSGGSWTVGSSSVATITGSTVGSAAHGSFTGIGTDSTLVTYTTAAGCTLSRVLRVNNASTLYYGRASICLGSTLLLSDSTTTTGSWYSTNTSIATVDASSGLASSVGAGIDTVYYINTAGCRSNTILTVNPTPGAIGGPSSVCIGSTVTLTNSLTGGTWISSNTAVATVTTSGVVTGVTAGTSTISYVMASGCFEAMTMTVNPNPSAVTGPTRVCAGSNITLSSATTGGTWSSAASNILINATTGVVNGLTAGIATVTYTVPSTGCYATYLDTVNSLPAAISGASSLCSGGIATTMTSTTTGGTWSSSAASVASVSLTGILTSGTAGSATITYTLPTGCYVTAPFTVNPTPAPISGAVSICQGGSTTLTNATTGGSWTSSGSAVTIGGSTGSLFATSVGTVTISYTMPSTGCYATTSFTVNPNPTPIYGGTTTVCAGGSTITLMDSTAGGSWSSSTAGVATVNSTTGVVTGVSGGSTIITYTVGATGCHITTAVTVVALPSAITGATNVCIGGTTTLASATTGGTWSTSTTSVATIGSSGIVTTIAVGSTTVSYTSASTGCSAVATLNVNPLPAPITGPTFVCNMGTTTLADTSAGGTWSTASTSIATAGSTTGVIYGVSVGSTTVTYTLPTGCSITRSITVSPLPAPIMGAASVCAGYTTVLSDSTAGGTWSSSTTSVATINTSGVVRGITGGSSTITYASGTTGCYVTRNIVVNGVVTPTLTMTTTPGTTVCAGTAVGFTTAITNGGSAPSYAWSVNGVILSGATSYSYTPANGDVVRVVMRSNAACAIPDSASATVTMTVNPIVTPSITISTGVGDTVCAGTITMTASTVGAGSSPTYRWFVNGVPVAGSGASYSYSPANGDVVSCTLVSSAPCRTADSASTSRTLTVSPSVTPSVAISSTVGSSICIGTSVTYTAIPTNGGTAPTYVWKVNGTAVGTGLTYTYVPNNADLVQVVMTSNFPCVTTTTATGSMTMAVNAITYPTGTISVSPGTTVPTGTTVTFTATVTSGGGSAPTFQWYMNGSPIPGATNSTFATSSFVTGDSISCMVTNTNPCSGGTTLPSVGMTVGWASDVNNVTINVADLAVFPNPNSGTFTIKGDLGNAITENVNVEITDMLGKVIYRNVILANKGVINDRLMLDGTVANGMYLINVKSEHIAKTFHFVVEQ